MIAMIAISWKSSIKGDPSRGPRGRSRRAGTADLDRARPGRFLSARLVIGVGFWANYTIVSTAAWCSYSYKYELAMQGDGNLVLYNRESGSAIWATGTYNHPGATAKMQSDGNFVVYDTNGTALWSTGTWWAGADSHFVFQNDGNLVVYKGKGEGNPVWASGTYGA
ncbi:hypothetical protein ACFXAF_08640 [Kitasatospora sp. NPDC059463]|uniref:hypothetical protein n=1 Tax=unclassified Kitasatospora TaxID=2633591 RepID=UPI0036AF7EF2